MRRRGYVVRKRDPIARIVRAELSRIKMEAYAGSLHDQLTKCVYDHTVAMTYLQGLIQTIGAHPGISTLNFFTLTELFMKKN